MNERCVDVLVVGAGVAGLTTALGLAPTRQVLVLDQAPGGADGCTAWAQGGIAAAVGADDDPADHAADTAASAFGHLARAVSMPAEGKSLEDVVREMLRPLLKAWLDEHLADIVEARVDAEVARIARTRGR